MTIKLEAARHDRASRGAQIASRLVAGLAAVAALYLVVFVWIGSENPALAAMILFLLPLALLVWHDQRKHERAIAEGRREALRAAARKAACPDCFGTGVWRGSGFAERCPTCKGGSR